MISPLVLLIAALAVARITRLITTDYLTGGIRAKLIARWGTDSPWSYLITCQWCASIWVSLAAAPVVWWWGDTPWVMLPALVLAFSQCAGLLSRGDDA
jgi:fatty acid desaturase